MSCNMYENLSLSDIECPICLDICLLPVTLPCSHIFCEFCLRNTVEHQAFYCPKCRKRIGNFLRRNKEIVNLKLWAAIQEQYPEEVKKKQNGEDSGVSEYLSAESITPKPKYIPGEIRKEFEKSLLEITELERKKQEEEEIASSLLIKEIEDEEKRLEEERQEQLLKDEELARSFAEELNTVEHKRMEEEERQLFIDGELALSLAEENIVITRSKAFSTPKATTPTQKLESFFQNLPTTSRGSSDDDSIGQEIHHFKPISTAPTTPPKIMPDGSSANNYVHPIIVLPSKNQFTSVVENIRTSITAAAEESDSAGPSKFGQEELQLLENENVAQLERDRLLALKLQKQWNKEEQNARKRTYNLRHNNKIKKKKTERGNRQSTLCRFDCPCCK